MGIPIVDIATGMSAAMGILLALHERTKSGQGQFVESSLYDNGLALLHPHSANHLLDGRVPGRSGNAHPNIVPYDTFATGTEPIFLAVGNDGQFAKLVQILGAASLSQDARFITNKDRNIHRTALKAALEDRLALFACKPLADQLIRAGVPCAPIQDVKTALLDEHTAHREMVVEIEQYKGIASPIKLSRTPASYRLPPPQRTP
jgi:crotonobetainyl-CoA:carnitine CoA-transferase CaiB-like acyl-CoA transferase